VKPYYRVLHKGAAQSHGPIHTRDEAEKHALESARIEPGKSFEVALVLSIASAPAPEASMFWLDGVQPDDPEHNPDNLTPEQVGVAGGWRLLRQSEVKERENAVRVQGWPIRRWVGGEWKASDPACTYRTRLPYGELDKAPARIKVTSRHK